MIREPIFSSDLPGSAQELVRCLKKEFKLNDNQLEIVLGTPEQVYFISSDSYASGFSPAGYLKILSEMEYFCTEFEAGLDINDYLNTEYLNDR